MLERFLLESSRGPWVWGKSDCTLWAADWVRLRTEQDPASEFRDAYETPRDIHRILEREGGFLAMVDKALASVGIDRTDDPMTGDVGMIAIESIDPDAMTRKAGHGAGFVMTIRRGCLWIGRSPRGLRGADWPFVAAWRVP